MVKAVKQRSTVFFLVLLYLVNGGCTSIISKQLRQQAAEGPSFSEIISDPEGYRGKVVILSGVIVSSKNAREGTLLEILQKPSDRRGKPKDVDESGGRFLALYQGYLDVAIYRPGRKVTIGGEISGKRVLPLGEINYTYPLITVKEIYLWPEEKEVNPRELYWPCPWWHPYCDWCCW